MPSTDVMCKVIPLYRVRILYNAKEKDDYDYERHIVADSIEGLIQGIVDIEIDHEEDLKVDKRHMVFDITDFLLMPYKDAPCRKYCLFDIDETDCAGWFGASIDSIYYHTYFCREEHPGPSIRDPKKSKFAEPMPVTGRRPKSDQSVPWEDAERILEEKRASMEAIYDLARDSAYRAERLAKSTLEKSKLYNKSRGGIEKQRSLENSIKILDKFIDEIREKNKKHIKPYYGKNPDVWLSQHQKLESIFTSTGTPTVGIMQRSVDDIREVNDYKDI